MQTARQIAYRAGLRAASKLGRYAYRGITRYYRRKKASAKKRSVKLFYEAQNITANINFNANFSLVYHSADENYNIMRMYGIIDIMNALVHSAAHGTYVKLYDEYKVASAAVFIIPYGLLERTTRATYGVDQASIFGVMDTSYKNNSGATTDIQWDFYQCQQNPKTKYVLWSSGSGAQTLLPLYANPETAEQKDDWTNCLDSSGTYLQPDHFNPIVYIGAQVKPQVSVLDVNAFPNGIQNVVFVTGLRLAFKVYYRKPRLADPQAHKDQEIFEKEIIVDITKKNE